jgi:hypothetical protein
MSRNAVSARVRVAAALVVVLLGGPLGPVAALHDRADDPACVPPAFADTSTPPSVGLAFECSPTDHCAVCHWLNGLRLLGSAPPLGAAGDAPSIAVTFPPVSLGDLRVALGIPGRSPPLASVHRSAG